MLVEANHLAISLHKDSTWQAAQTWPLGSWCSLVSRENSTNSARITPQFRWVWQLLQWSPRCKWHRAPRCTSVWQTGLRGRSLIQTRKVAFWVTIQVTAAPFLWTIVTSWGRELYTLQISSRYSNCSSLAAFPLTTSSAVQEARTAALTKKNE